MDLGLVDLRVHPDSLLIAARDTSRKGSRLAQLYLDRCYRLSAGDLHSVQSLEEQIRALQAQA